MSTKEKPVSLATGDVRDPLSLPHAPRPSSVARRPSFFVQAALLFAGCVSLYAWSGTAIPQKYFLVQDVFFDGDVARVIGAIGVIGPTRLNYGRIIPVVNYTSQMISKIIG